MSLQGTGDYYTASMTDSQIAAALTAYYTASSINTLLGGYVATNSVTYLATVYGAAQSIQRSTTVAAWTNAGGTYTTNATVATSTAIDNGVARIEYDKTGLMSVVLEMSASGSSWTAFAPTANTVYVRLRLINDVPSPGDLSTSVSNIVAYAWSRPDLFGQENDTEGQTLLVDDPAEDRQAVNKRTLGAAIDAVTPAAWSQYPATQTVYMAGNKLLLGSGWSVIETEGIGVLSYADVWGGTNGLVIANNGTPAITMTPGLAGLQIATFTVDGGTGTVGVATNGVESLPLLQWSQAIDWPDWQTLIPVSETYPATNAAGHYEIVAVLPGPSGFLRAMRATGAQQIEAHAALYEMGERVATTSSVPAAAVAAIKADADWALVESINSATRTPHFISCTTNITISAANGIQQAVTGDVPASVTINFPTGEATSETTISVTLPPAGTNEVVFAAGPTYYYVSPLSSSVPASTNLYTRYYIVSPYGSTNASVTVMGEVQ
jgi:hypothetical protein